VSSAADLPPSDELSCRELVELVTDYLEGALAERERARFELHLVYCEGCENYLEQMRRTIATVGQLREEDADPQALDDLLGAFREWKRGAARS
jgi:predicted anti-sigma-YlaC factor YlaD